MMEKNVGETDANVRYVLGVLILAGAALTYLFVDAAWSLAAAAVGLILAAVVLVTATVRVCPLYVPFGFSTARARGERRGRPVPPARRT